MLGMEKGNLSIGLDSERKMTSGSHVGTLKTVKHWMSRRKNVRKDSGKGCKHDAYHTWQLFVPCLDCSIYKPHSPCTHILSSYRTANSSTLSLSEQTLVSAVTVTASHSFLIDPRRGSNISCELLPCDLTNNFYLDPIGIPGWSLSFYWNSCWNTYLDQSDSILQISLWRCKR